MTVATIITIIVVALGVIIAVGLIAVAVSNRSESDPLADRLGDYASEQVPTANLEEIELSVPFSQRVMLPIMNQIASFTRQFTPEETLQKTERQLELAGKPSGLTPPTFWVMRFMAMFGLGFVLLFVFVTTGQKALFIILGLIGGGAMGFFLPQMWLSSKISRRQDEILKSLPDALDLMSICVEAGLGFDQAMIKVHDKWDNELALAFGRVTREIQLGKSRRDALRNMAEGIDVPDVTTFAGAIIQADQLGVSISKVLKVQAETMRIKRRQRAQEKAQAAPVKMMIPLVLFIFPTLWMVLLGPAGVQIYKQFFTGG